GCGCGHRACKQVVVGPPAVVVPVGWPVYKGGQRPSGQRYLRWPVGTAPQVEEPVWVTRARYGGLARK
ncbi:unnamed protein product, partial [Musa textilis]